MIGLVRCSDIYSSQVSKLERPLPSANELLFIFLFCGAGDGTQGFVRGKGLHAELRKKQAKQIRMIYGEHTSSECVFKVREIYPFIMRTSPAVLLILFC